MGSATHSLPIIDRNVVLRDPILAQHQPDLRCSEITSTEVTYAFIDMNSTKALDINGCIFYFFKSTWNIVGDIVIVAVGEFFKSRFMYILIKM